jgi:hypothetical protein
MEYELLVGSTQLDARTHDDPGTPGIQAKHLSETDESMPDDRSQENPTRTDGSK